MSDKYEVVICPDGAYNKDHAELLKKRLMADGFYDDVVSIREIDE